MTYDLRTTPTATATGTALLNATELSLLEISTGPISSSTRHPPARISGDNRQNVF